MKKLTLAASLLLSSVTAQAELVGHWTFDNTLNDASGNGYHALSPTPEDLSNLDSRYSDGLNPVTFETDTPAGSDYNHSVAFNSNSYLTADLSWADAGAADAFTISTWVKYDGESNFFIFDFDRSENLMLAFYEQGIFFSITDNTGVTHDYHYNTHASAGHNDWNHLFVSYGSQNGLQFYENGQRVFSDSYKGTLGKDRFDRYLTIGDGSESGWLYGGHHVDYANGQLSDVAFWNHEYTKSQYVSNEIFLGNANLSNLQDVSAPVTALSGLALCLLGFRQRRQTGA